MKENIYYSIRWNNNTAFCLPNVVQHIKIKVPYWLPICVMVLSSPIRSYFRHGLRIQFFDDVVAAAKQCTEIDGKPRVVTTMDIKSREDNIIGRCSPDSRAIS